MNTKTTTTYLELQSLVNKWKGKPEPEFMSKEYIDRRIDRIRYQKLKAQLNTAKAAGQLVNMVKDIFEV